MTSQAPDAASDYNTKIIEEFRANRGRVGGIWAGTTLILIHHIGAKSGTERVTPVGCFLQPDGRFVIVASNGGAAAHPAWYYNLKANPRINVDSNDLRRCGQAVSQPLGAIPQDARSHAAAKINPWPVSHVSRSYS
jgi:deazaflavin-dependent oxidoreductase (nitroreductase family)